MYLGVTDLFQARWTDAIHDEWMRSVAKNYPDIPRSQLERVRKLMDAHAPECLVSNYEHLIDGLKLPDANDRHVLAAAIHAEADLIVTANLAHFPPEELAKHGIEALPPDRFVMLLVELDPQMVCAAAKRQRESLKNPPMTVDEFLATLERQGLSATVAALRSYAAVL
jgi:predicted nucleic acid-binding protein